MAYGGRYGEIPQGPPGSKPRGLFDTGTTALGGAGTVVSGAIDPAGPYKDLQAALGKASKALAALQWQRQMEGLGRALGFVNHSQGAINQVYGQHQAPGASLPAGLGPQLPQNQPQGAPGKHGPGLAAYLGRGR
jgi:hypothetical protein